MALINFTTGNKNKTQDYRVPGAQAPVAVGAGVSPQEFSQSARSANNPTINTQGQVQTKPGLTPPPKLGQPNTPTAEVKGRDMLAPDKKQELATLISALEERGAAPEQITQAAQNYFNENAQPPTQEITEPQREGGIKGFLKSLVSPELSAVASGIRGIQSIPEVAKQGIALLKGDRQGAGEANARATEIQNKPLFGAKTFMSETPQELTGQAIQTVGQGITGGAPVLGAAGQVLGSDVEQGKSFKKTATDTGLALITGGALKVASPYLTRAASKFYEAAPQGVKDVVTAAGQKISSGLASAGEAVNPALEKITPGFMEKGVKENASNLLGKLTGRTSIQQKAVDELQKTYDDIFTGTKAAKKSFIKSEQAGKNPSEFLAKNGYIVDVEKGKINSDPLISKINEDVKPYNEVLSDILKQKDRVMPSTDLINLDEISSQAKKALNTPFNKASGTLSKQETAIDNIVEELKKQYGPKINLSTLNEIKQGQWAQSAAFDLSQPRFMPDVNYALGSAAKKTIEDNVDEVSIKALNQHIGDHYDSIFNLKKINGNAVKGGRLGKYFGRVLGMGIGSSAGGPVGGLAGAFVGDFVSELMQNNAIAGPLKQQILAGITAESPLYEAAQQALMKLKYGQPLLMPGRGPGKSVNVPINLPSKVRPLESTTNMKRTRIIRPSGVSKSQPVTQIFGGESNVKK